MTYVYLICIYNTYYVYIYRERESHVKDSKYKRRAPAAGTVLEVTRFTDSQRMSGRSQRRPGHGTRVLEITGRGCCALGSTKDFHFERWDFPQKTIIYFGVPPWRAPFWTFEHRSSNLGLDAWRPSQKRDQFSPPLEPFLEAAIEWEPPVQNQVCCSGKGPMNSKSLSLPSC